ncbi:transcriptional regulator [Mycobacteroides abscessus subsp. abscessus]|nr:transcriptional regulator [Mycobacteroides abscessus subsp. abscessus]
MLERIRLARVLSLAAAVLGADTLDARIAAFGRWAEENIGDVGWLTVEVEFAIGTRHLDDLREELAVRRREITDTLAELIDQQARPAHDAAVRLLSLGIGLGVQRAFDPEVPVTPIVDALRELLTGAATRPAGLSVAPDAAKP